MVKCGKCGAECGTSDHTCRVSCQRCGTIELPSWHIQERDRRINELASMAWARLAEEGLPCTDHAIIKWAEMHIAAQDAAAQARP